MSSPGDLTSTPDQPTSVRFSLRSLLMAMAIASLYLAAWGLLARKSNARELGDAAWMSLCTLFAYGLGTIVGRHTRYRSGEVIARLPTARPDVDWAIRACATPFVMIVLMQLLPGHERTIPLIRVFLTMLTAISVVSMFHSLFARSIAICENGLAAGYEVPIAWDRVKRAGWSIDGSGLVIFGGGLWRRTALVPPESRTAVEAFLKNKLEAPRSCSSCFARLHSRSESETLLLK